MDSTNKSNGVGEVLISLQGEEIKLAIWIHFRASNNEVEYETLLIGLQATQNVGTTWILVYLDSQLVV